MGITLGFLMIVLPVGAMNLDSLEGKWTASVRLDNLFRMDTYFSAWVSSDHGDASLYSQQRTSFGFPTEYSVLWKVKKDLAVGLGGGLDYRKESGGRYAREWDDRREEGEYDGSYWDGSLVIEICKYFKKDKRISPFVSVCPFVSGSHWEKDEDGVCYHETGDTTFYSYTMARDLRRYGVNLDWGGEVFFKLSSVQMGIRMKSTLVRFWRGYYEYSRVTKDAGDASLDYTREENLTGVDFDLPTQGNFSMWLCFYF